MPGSGAWSGVITDEITCRQFVELLTDYFEGDLSEPILSLVEQHLMMCDWCVTYAEQMHATIAALRTLPGEHAPDAVQQAVAVALRERRADGDADRH